MPRAATNSIFLIAENFGIKKTKPLKMGFQKFPPLKMNHIKILIPIVSIIRVLEYFKEKELLKFCCIFTNPLVHPHAKTVDITI